MTPVPVLEVGGTHVAAALVSASDWTVSGARRLEVDAEASADELIARFVAAARSVAAPPGATWGVAMPDPFDYAAGVARFDAAVGKFGALNGVDVGAALRSALAADVVFLNDADAFALGEATSGVGRGFRRLAAITLGTGVGSGWIVDGAVVVPDRPLNGRIHHVQVGGEPIEDLMSRRAVRRRYMSLGGSDSADVREIADLARAGDERAVDVLSRALRALGTAVKSVLDAFRPDVLVLGGSMAASWDLFEPWFRAGAADARALPPVRVSADAERSGFVGAAVHAGGLSG